jgi:hypothetical protein
MNVMRPPPCPPFSESWRELVACYGSVEDFKAFMTEVINDIGSDVFATRAYVDARYADLANQINQVETDIITGVTDGSIAGPGEIGEVVFGIFPPTPGSLSDTYTVGDTIPESPVMTLPAGDWQMSFQAVLVLQSGSLSNIGFVGLLGGVNFGNILIGIAGTTDLQIPSLVWAGSIAADLPVSVQVSNVQGEAGATFKFAIYCVAFRKR